MRYEQLVWSSLLLLLISVEVTQARGQVVYELSDEVSASTSDGVVQTSWCRCCNREDDGILWNSYTEWTFKPGDNRVLGGGELFVPLWQDSGALLFADLRGQIDDRNSAEGNWGLGLRRIMEDDWILGLYGFYDLLHTSNNNNFNQVMFGIEALSVEWEARFNGYIPEGGTKLVPGASLLPYATVSNSNVVIRSGGTGERAYYGFDAEVGALLSDWNCGDTELRAYVGGFHFDTSDSSYPNISGPRARLELRAYDVNFLGNGSRVALSVEAQWDQVRNEQVFAILSVRFPLRQPYRNLSRLERRMLDGIVRDVDVVTTGGNTATFEEMAIDPSNGTALRVIDANSTGVPGIVNGAGANSTVFALGDAGQIDVNATIVLQNGQTFRSGAGLSMNVEGATTGDIVSFTVPGNVAPVVNGTNVAADVFHLANDSTLRDITITGGLNGVSTNGANLTGLTIDGNNVSGAAVDGFNLGDIAASSSVTNNTANNNGNDGFEFVDVLGGSTFTNNTANNNTEYGFNFYNVAGTFTDNTANNNTFDGITFFDVVAGGTFTGNTANNNTWGFFFADVAGGTFTNNSATGNFQDGFQFGDVLAGSTFSSNTANSNGLDGFNIWNIAGTFTGNTATGNGYAGFLVDVSGGMFTGNTATGNGTAGFDFDGISGGTIMGNTATGNKFGFSNGDMSGGTFANNTANNNTEDGFNFINGVFSGGTFTDNQADGNGYSGFYFGDIGGTFTTNTANGNGDDGFLFYDIAAGGTFSNNLSTNNTLMGYNNNMGLIDGAAASNTGSGNGSVNTFP